MQTILTDLRSSAIISFLIVLPFVILEWVNRQSFRESSHESFPIPLFGFLWFLPLAFIVILIPLVRNLRAGNSIMANPVSLLLRVVFLILIA
ncbi:MAG: hypothetical protein AB1801_14730, partial [Chloroflexota bacterium]